jgi:CHAT domain-containing protein/tetratricopeptide (TPR) repeat protein
MFDWLVNVARTSNLLNQSEYSKYLDFLIEVLKAIAQNDGKSEAVYPLLEADRDKLNDNLILVLRELVTIAFEQAESEQKQNLADIVFKFSNLIQQFPQGIRANNFEIAISCDETILKFYTREAFPQKWAMIQNELANAYSSRIKGNTRENIETTIACYQNALRVYTELDFPVDWAMVQYNLGNSYFRRIEGNKRENIESAITYYDEALKVYNEVDSFLLWAKVQSNLGVVYCDRIEGQRRDNLESAIECHQNALKVYTESDFPVDWALIQSNLGVAFNNRIEGQRRDNLELAIQHYQNALKVRTQENFPTEWAITQNNLGTVYNDRIAGDRQENIESAITSYQNALRIITEENLPYDWAMTQHNLGLAYSDRIKGNKKDNLELAIKHYQNALKVKSQENFPSDWAITQNSLGNAYVNRIAGERRENLESAIIFFQNALKVYTQENFPLNWAETQGNLGTAYHRRIEGDKKENIELVIKHDQSALKVFTEVDSPQHWAKSQNNLGNAYVSRIAGDRKENLESAIFYFRNALRLYTESNSPTDWAMAQNNLGSAYHRRIAGDKKENLELAIACFRNALRVRTESDFPIDWAESQNNLGYTYANLIAKDRRENIEFAISCYQNTLRVYSESNFPTDWATIQNNLGIAYLDLDRIKDNKETNIESAIVCFQNALRVYSESDFPTDWATIQNNLGLAYSDRMTGDRKENIETAISCYQAALTINTPKTNPIECLTNSNNLGYLAFNESNWQLAIDAYATAIKAVETSRSWSISDDRRLQIQNEAIGVYHNIVQSYINIGQIDKAIEYTERSRSRTLVDLMASNDLYGDAEIPLRVKEFLQQFNQLQQEIDTERFRTQNDSQSNNQKSLSRAAWTEIKENITELETQKLQIWQEIRKLDPILAGEIKVDAPDFATIQQLIDNSQTAILSFYTTSQDTHIFILFKDKPPQLYTCLGQSSETLQKWIYENWLQPYQRCKDIPLKIADTQSEIKEIQNKTQEQPELLAKLAQLQEELQKLREELVQLQDEWRSKIIPSSLSELSQRLKLNNLINEHLEGIQELIIIPHLFLHQIPFAALPVTRGIESDQEINGLGVTLSDRFDLRHIPSCQILQFCQERLDTTQPDLSKGEVKIGTVEDADGTLPGANLEGEKIARLFNIPRDQRLRGHTQATVSNYRQLAKQVNLLHSSHHAQSRLDSPLESTLILGDGTITLGELLTPSWRLRNLRDVFLSCCETNLGKSEIADDIFTLGTGFLCAGAKSVVSSLWAVDDLSTALFGIFYYQLRHEGYSRSQAVQKAQSQLRTMTGKELYSYLQQEYRQAETEYQQAKKKLNKIAKDTPEYQELAAKKENINQIAKNFRNLWKKNEQYCQQQFPFEHPFYWAGFISQGIR